MTFDGVDAPVRADGAVDPTAVAAADPIALAVLASTDATVPTLQEDPAFEVAFEDRPTFAAVADVGEVDVHAVVLAHDGGSPGVIALRDALRERTGRPIVLYADAVDTGTLRSFLDGPGTDYVHRGAPGSEIALENRLRAVAEHAVLAESHGLLERAVDQAAIGVTIADMRAPDQPLIYANAGFTTVTGYPRESIIGRNCRFLQGEDTDPDTVDAVRDAIDAGEPVEVDIHNYRQDGTPFWNHLALSPVFDDDGDLTHYFGFQRDVTERKELEAELRTQNDRLESFASVLSHDLRNPLSVARGNVDQLEAELADGESGGAGESAGDDAVSESIEAIDDALSRMDDLVTDVLALARGGQRIDDRQSVSLADVAQYAWSMVETDDLVLDVTDVDAVVVADRDRLTSAFENLFRNAVEHATDATTVQVRTTPDGFVVSDDGPGVPPDARDRLFERGYTDATDGTGFGLAIVDAVADAHGWTVTVSTGEHGGAAFAFTDVDVTHTEP